jgi:type IV secretion system protein VirB4
VKLWGDAPMADMIPITAHVDPFIVRTKEGHYVQTLRLGGLSFESADDDAINNWHTRLNLWLRNIASPNLALWTHIIRRRDFARTHGTLPPGFARDVDRKYSQRLAGETLMVNELYASLVFRPQVSAAGIGAMKFLKKTDPAGAMAELTDSLEQCAKLRGDVLAALDRYDPEPLGIYVNGGRRFSSLLEFFGVLVNGEWQRMPLPRAPLNEVLGTSDTKFGNEAVEYRTPTRTRFGAFLGFKEYPAIEDDDGVPSTVPGMFNAMLSAPFSFILAQSFAPMTKGAALTKAGLHEQRMVNTDDPSATPGMLKALKIGLGNNAFVAGWHHFTLQVMAESFDGVAEEAGKARLKRLNDNLAIARDMLANTGAVIARETLALKSAFWSQLPGNFDQRPRPSPITSLNMIGMGASFHNYPTGREHGNHWGDALTMFVTNAGSPHHFSLHASDPRVEDGGSRKDVAHTTGLEPTGGGKTVKLAFLVTQAMKFNAAQVIFDKDEGLHILVKRLGGQYLPLKNGKPTGCNPLQLNDTEDAIEFFRNWLRVLVRRNGVGTTVRQERDLEQALMGTMALPRPSRRLSRLVEFLDPTDLEGMHARLLPWCEGGAYGWVFDNPTDQVVPMLDHPTVIGFDVTDFLDNPTVRTPLTQYLFHLVNAMVDGRKMIVWCDEFARLLNDEAFSDFAKNGLEAWRKANAAFVGFTQMASHILDSPIARSIIEQTATWLLGPNPKADRAEYAQLGVPERVFAMLKTELEPGSRQFVIGQGHNWTVAKLDLQGFDAELAVLSGRKENLPLMHRAIAMAGPDPARWGPVFDSLVAGGLSTTLRLPASEIAHA